MKSVLKFVVAFYTVFFTVAAVALAADLPASPRPEAKGGFIAGKVTDEAGSPLTGARAEAYSCVGDTLAGSARTDAKGEYQLGPVADGCYHVRFDGDGYESTWHGKEGFRDAADDVAVAGGAVQGIDGLLSPAASAITGTVQSQDRKPLSGVWVTAIQESEGVRSISDGRTDGMGRYRIQVATGRYIVLFMGQGYVTKIHGPSLKDPTMVDAAEGKTASGIDAVLAKGGRITGRVTDETRKPLQGIYVLGQAVGAVVLPITTRTRVTGEFTLDGVPTGRYRIAFGDRERKYQLQWHEGKTDPEEATEVAVTAPKTTSGIKGILRLAGGISGRVTDASGNALAGVMVLARATPFGFGSAITDETGAYSVPGLPSGAYKVSFNAQDGIHLSRNYRDASNEDAALPVEVTAPNVTYGIDQVLPTGTLLTGIVRSPGGEPLEGVAVSAYPAGSAETQMTGFALTSHDGTFSVPLQEGEYVLHYSHSEGGYLEQWSGGAPTRSNAKPVAVSKERGAEKQVVVLSPGGSISGIVRNRAGNRVAGVRVSANDSTTGDRAQSAVSNDRGAYIIRGIPSGSFRVTADGSAVGYVRTKLPQPVEVSAPRAVENVDIVVARGGSIAGTISDRTGKLLQRVNVTANDPETWDEVGSAYSDENGTYTIGGLPEGKYRVRFEGPDSKYPVQWHKGKTRREESTPIEVAGTAAVSGIDAMLAAGIPLSGMVTDAGGVPLANAEVEAYGDIEDEPFDKVRTDAGGRFTIPSLAVGSYRIRFSHRNHVPQWYGGRDRKTAAPFAVKEGGVPPLSVSLPKAGGKISGKLTNPEGVKIGQSWETVIDALTGVAVADERICECSGQFHTPVPGGVYKVRIERHGLVTWFGGNTREEAAPLSVHGEVAEVDLVIEEKEVRQKQQLPSVSQKP